MPIEYPIDLIHRDGSIFRLDTPEAASKYRYSFDRHHRQAVRFWNGQHDDVRLVENDWIARDALGAVVDSQDIPEAARRPWWLRALRETQHAAERGLPIPGTGGHNTRYRRTVGRYVAETARNLELDDELAEAGLSGMRVCRKRRIAHCRYDDAERRFPQRCWKEQRRTRWKAS